MIHQRSSITFCHVIRKDHVTKDEMKSCVFTLQFADEASAIEANGSEFKAFFFLQRKEFTHVS